MSAVVATGLGLSVMSFLLMFLKLRETAFSANRQKIRKSMRIQKYPRLSRKEIYVGLGMGILIAGLATSLSGALQLFVVGFIFGVIGFRYFESLRLDVVKNNFLREMSVLFDAVDLYVKAGYTMFQALKAAKILTPSLAPHVQRCLDKWPASPKEALNQLKKDLAVPEGEMLTSLLIYMETTGTKNLEGVLAQEAYNIEQLRRMRIESSISKKPLLIMMYRFLPVFSVIGIVAGTLMYRLALVVVETGIYNFSFM